LRQAEAASQQLSLKNEISSQGVLEAGVSGESLFRVKREMDLEPKSRARLQKR
jgi:hypothetical protein